MTLSNLNSAPRAVFILLAMLQITAMKLDNGPKSKLLKNSPLISKYKETKEVVTTALTKNPLAQSIIELYDFFYWLPRRNVIYEHPPVFWLNNTIQYLGWYQVPHNLPPYGYLPNAWPAGMYCLRFGWICRPTSCTLTYMRMYRLLLLRLAWQYIAIRKLGSIWSPYGIPKSRSKISRVRIEAWQTSDDWMSQYNCSRKFSSLTPRNRSIHIN